LDGCPGVVSGVVADTPVVCLLGPRQSGKTTLARVLAPERTFISLDEQSYYQTANIDPPGFVASLPDAITLDEIQRAPNLLNAIKQTVDNDRRPGRFLLTGSANLLLLPRVTESLAGRIEIVQLQPLTESEKARSPSRFLADFLAGLLRPTIGAAPEIACPSVPERLVAGGYPEPLTRSPERARQWHRNYLKSMIERDVQDIVRIRDVRELSRLLELLALRSAELLNISNLARDLGLHRDTVDHYVGVLERLFLVRRLPAWHGNPSRRLIKTPKIHLLDSGLAATLAGLTANDWLANRNRMGHLLESFGVQQLIAQAAWTNPDLRFWHYRDKDQVEVGLVITLGEKTWGVEIKAASVLAPRDGQGLSRLADRCGQHYQGGIMLYGGRDTLPIAPINTLAVPISELWNR